MEFIVAKLRFFFNFGAIVAVQAKRKPLPVCAGRGNTIGRCNFRELFFAVGGENILPSGYLIREVERGVGLKGGVVGVFTVGEGEV
ncbi:MAG: hypothetical protein KIG57_00395, partial [Muribaculaceae bacterium]|nr:hypothetical protein [Muribaculaceae bacterium]